jgi:hypothetical protein
MNGPAKRGQAPLFKGQDAMANLQTELADAYGEAHRAWTARLKVEMELWSQLGSKLASTHSAPEALQAYQECFAQRMRLAMEDGQKMSEDCQKFTQKIVRSLSNGWVGEKS